MGRVVPIVVAMLALGLAFVLPEASRARLAAAQAHELLEQPVGGEADEPPPLWKVVLDGPAARRLPEGGTELTLYGAALRDTTGEEAALDVLALTHAMRSSLVRGFRQHATQAPYAPLVIRGETPGAGEQGGANFELVVGRGDDGRTSRILMYTVDGDDSVRVAVGGAWSAPRSTSVLPPLVAVALAVAFRRPLVALFAGVLVGAFLHRRIEGDGAWLSAFGGLLDTATVYFREQLLDDERAMIIGFVVFMLAMVGVMTRAGGIRGMMDAVASMASSARRTQVATWLMGLAVFFDDYANTILVGSTMRPLSDRFRVSREKLAYIVDSTAAPVAGLSIFSTWIAFEVSTFNNQLPAAGLATTQGYEVFLKTIPYSFYCIFTLVLVGLLVLTGRDLGPMRTAERRARSTGALLRPGSTPMVSGEATEMEAAEGVRPRAWRAIVPLVGFVVVTLLEIARLGGAFAADGPGLTTIEGITTVLYDGSGSRPLLVGSLAGFLLACVGAWSAGIGGEVPRASWTTLRSMWVAFAILYLAWMIGKVCEDVGTAPYLTGLAGDGIDPLLLPTLLFVLAGVIAFATGSSWSTMSILLPLVVGLAYELGVGTELGATAPASGQMLMVMSIAAVLSGAIFGDHCSPISDTTVMSSIASASDHIDHVRTQAPYALLAMAVSIVAGYLPATYLGLSPWISLVAGVVVLAALVFALGRRSEVGAA